ncbi:TIGR01459 family HAD-type hydrolase [Jannaschia ovalis]|uniref:TIGR01459 family HAD-type hydrolase n=1 Tax=Jannaschia ovalis TaxID=3038773 RepID=A0ABY8LFY5_9RHOB|nr:TIGR01459 family HAD-type hydrolase [Jannaschia sp. GRR-S6-38]WGH79260.1 TIGR01459 family HAD-type hydrolase [Jannaschia sp. GRR-S6-38]
MTRRISDLSQIAGAYDAVVLDQWGVLHDGDAPYPGAVAGVRTLAEAGTRLAVLSNSGKRAAVNAQRIAGIGFQPGLFETVMTSGEALWRDLAAGRVEMRRLLPIERAAGDAEAFCAGLAVTLSAELAEAEAVLLMGLPDDAAPDRFAALFDAALARGVPVICTNPDRASPWAGGITVASPGALAHDFARRGGTVRFYGKPHEPVFDALATALGVPPARLLMVGDSLEHDIAGGHAAGWATAFVRGGLHRAAFDGGAVEAVLDRLLDAEGAPPPDFTLDTIGGHHA